MINKTVLFFACCFLLSTQVQAKAFKSPVKAELVSDYSTLSEKTDSARLGVFFKIDSGWHIYWRNAGDSGVPTQIQWILPKPIQAKPLLWPAPKKFKDSSFTTYGYEKEVLLITPITIKNTGVLEESFLIKAQVRWVACKKVCVPGKATLVLILKTKSDQDQPSKWNKLFDETALQLPLTNHSLKITAALKGREVLFVLPNQIPDPSELSFYPYNPDWMKHGGKQTLISRQNFEELIVLRNEDLSALPPKIEGLFMSSNPWNAQSTSKSIEVSLDLSR